MFSKNSKIFLFCKNGLKNLNLHIVFIYIIEYGHEAKPSILGLQIVFLAARMDDGGYGYYCARQEL